MRIGTPAGTSGQLDELRISNVQLTSFRVVDTQAPTVPTGLAATAPGGPLINLVWAAATDYVGVTNYKVFQNGQATPVATLGNGVNSTGSGFGYTALGLAPGTLYTPLPALPLSSWRDTRCQ